MASFRGNHPPFVLLVKNNYVGMAFGLNSHIVVEEVAIDF